MIHQVLRADSSVITDLSGLRERIDAELASRPGEIAAAQQQILDTQRAAIEVEQRWRDAVVEVDAEIAAASTDGGDAR
ncbi:hypothetical protein PS9374_04602 [Planomonospora sphaerica]|uniref:Uncharacterized protein n=1 Tax=Planomonospora sphaerica TaxID=161355 RepID=A0A171DJC1_9ACTN|nr:hypothetical protein [Planomonospora sphaerica]GAT68937.1 hypothetical protein PS9374_04602 [Planomonospora sphaerica]